MKKTSLFITLLTIFALAFSFNACSTDSQSSNEKKLIGEWKLESQSYSDGRSSDWNLETIKLYEDGTCSVDGEMGTWKVVDDELMILGSYGGRFWNSDSIVGKYSCNGKTLEFQEAQIDGKDNSVNLVYQKSK